MYHWPSSQESLLKQFHEAGIHMFAWQETRLRRSSNFHDERFWLFRSSATSQGHFGIVIGLQRKLPIGHDGTRDIFFAEHEISLIAAAPRFLILRVCNPLVKCILIGAHAPHTGAECSYIDEWWKDLAAAIPTKYQGWDRILLADANARVGSEPNRHVGDHQAESFDPKAEGFLSFVFQQGLWLPSTFAHCHQGLGMTWRHSRGNWFRNDFVGLPLHWTLSHCKSWVSADIDVGLAKEDHRAPIVHLQREVTLNHFKRPEPALKLHSSDFDLDKLCLVEKPDWTIDVHSHASSLQKSVFQALRTRPQQGKSRPQRASMSELTWQLVRDKRLSRNLLHDHARVQRRTLLESWFACWKHSVCDCPFDRLAHAYNGLLCEQDRLIAAAYHQFRKLGTQVSRALRADDVGFYTGLLQECSEFLHPKDVKQLWQIVRRSLPKFQQRRFSIPPQQLECLEEQWLPHYSELEAGLPVKPQQLVADCAFEQALRRLDAPSQICLRDLPCLTQLEQAFRAVTAGKATGFDPLPSDLFHMASAQLAALHHDLVLKEFVWQSEPVQDKGGPVALIPKTLHPSSAKQFRGILLLPSVGKRAHAILRSQVMEKLEIARAPGQLGGFPGQQVSYGSHALRSFGTLCDQAGLSSAILFLDLASAFHHLIRESVVGAYDGSNLKPVLAVLQQSGHPIDQFHAFARLPGLLADIGVAEPIIRLLRDIHVGTWCSLHQRWLLRTHRGMRPGSPLADIIFHALMTRVAQSVDEWLTQQNEIVHLKQALDIEVPTILWADDIAVPLAARQAIDIVPLLQMALGQVRQTLRAYGFTLNFSKGKTSAVVTFKGTKAGELRKKFQLNSQPGTLCTFDDGASEWLHFVSTYRHLGTLFASNHDLHCELKTRVGIAKAAFAQLAKPILTNRNLPCHLRLQFFQSLIATKLFFGLGAWVTPAPKHLQYLQNALVGMLKRVLRINQDHVPTDKVLMRAQTAEVRARLAVDRLLYAQRLFRTGPAFLHHLLHQEYACTSQSWFHGLRADLEWMENVNPGCLAVDWRLDMTALFELWQAPQMQWTRAVKKTWYLHLAQNAIIADAKCLHANVFRNLKAAGASFDMPFSEVMDWENKHDCFCGASFGTNRGLLAHQRKAHALFSVERQFLQGSTCLHCGKFLWSTQRLQQHLAYIPKGLGYNPCFHALQSQARQVPYCHENLGNSPAFAGLHRRECLQTEGPAVNPRTIHEIQRVETLQAIAECDAKLAIPHRPADHMSEGEKIGEELTQATLSWFRLHYPQGPSAD
jgi:hypothetical protein